jgi:hypothetical protein
MSRFNKKRVSAGQALDRLSKAFKDDPDYAHSWHCAVACCAMDEGLNREAANKAASRFMKMAFEVDTK